MVLGRTFCSLKNVWLRKIEISDKGIALFDVMDHSYFQYEINQEDNFKNCAELRQMNCPYNSKRHWRRAVFLPLLQCQVHRHLDQGHFVYYHHNLIVLYFGLVTCFTNDLTTNFACQPAIHSLFYLLGRRNSEKKFLLAPDHAHKLRPMK